MIDETADTADRDAAIVAEAKTRFQLCVEWERVSRQRGKEDERFLEGDSDNGYQWEDAVRLSRQQSQQPCLTINRTRQHCLQIMNAMRQQKTQIRISPVGDDASYESAKIFEGLCRHIEYQSNAAETYESASWHQIGAGIGYWRVTTDYVDDDSLDQEIFIKRVRDPRSVYLDPHIEEFDGSDARYGFVFRDVPREVFDREYPEAEGEGTSNFDGDTQDEWDSKDTVRLAEYFRKMEKRRTTLIPPPEVTQELGLKPMDEGKLKKEAPDIHKALSAHPGTKRRETTDVTIEWFKIAGSRIVERNVWPGRYVPIVRCVGEETVIDGELDRKGHVRAMKDAQRMYNWHSSSMVQHIAAQSKSPWLTPVAAVEGLETYWRDANTELRAYLPYNHVNDEGQEIPAPSRNAPPTTPAASIEALKIAQNEMMMASGQFQSQFGEAENAKSGVAIQTRERQGDTATYHFTDHQAQAIKFTGRILIDLIPKIYDTRRIRFIMAEDGDKSDVDVDPEAPLAHQMTAPAQALGQQTPNGRAPISPDQAKMLAADKALTGQIKTVFNPNVGRYSVEADVGPMFATKRQETFNALSQLLSQNQHLAGIAGDLLFKAADFPMADEVAERLRRTIPPQVLGEGPPPQLVQLQQEAQQKMQGLQQVIGKLMQDLAESKMKLRDQDSDLQRKDYEAETARMAAIGKIDPAAFMPVIRQMVSEALATPIVPLMAAHAVAEQSMMPAPMPDPSATPSQQPDQGATSPVQ